MRTDRWTFWLVLVMALTAAYALSSTGWSDQLGPVPAAALLGTLLAWLLSRGRWGARRAALVFALYGVGFMVCVLVQESQPPFETATAWEEMHVRLWMGLARVAEFLGRAYTGRSNTDPLIFSLAMSGLTWALAGVSAWSAFRLGRFWPALVPSALGLLAIGYYYRGPVSERAYLGLYFLLGLLLLLHLIWRDQTELWQAQSVKFTEETGYQFARVGIVTASLLLLTAWSAASHPLLLPSTRPSAPSLAWTQLHDTFQRWFGDLRSPAGPTAGDYYGDSLALGGGIRLAAVPVMEVSASKASPAGRYYWRSMTYDEYQDGAWSSTGSQSRSFDPEKDRLTAPDEASRYTVDLTFQTRFPAIARPFLSADPLWVSLPLTVQVDPGTNTFEFARSSVLLPQGAEYTEQAALLQVDQASLRQAGVKYPDSILQRYLQLPSTISERTRELARTAAAGASTPYDQATLITAFLRKRIAYDTNIPSPPSGQDPIDWVLFDSQRGYCNYYASAEVILLRSLGVPARLAAGFAQGRAARGDPLEFTILESDAHAWPEVFFPGIGWVEFEPTPSQPPLLRPALLASNSAEAQPLPSPSAEPRLRNRQQLLPATASAKGVVSLLIALLRSLALAAVALGLGGSLAWAATIYLQGDSPATVVRDWTRASIGLAHRSRGPVGTLRSRTTWRLALPHSGLSLPAQGYVWMGRLARWASLSLGTHLTPLERASALKSSFPDLAGALATIAAAYTADCYSWPSPSGRWSQGQQAEFKRARWALAAAALPLVPEHLLEQASARLRASWRRL